MRSHEYRRRPRVADGGSSGISSKHHRKLQQLCRQAYRALMYAIPGDMADPLLQELSVDTVLPAPDAGRLLVCLSSPRTPSDPAEILSRLARVEGYLRAQIAQAITRKHAPELTFHLAFKEVKP